MFCCCSSLKELNLSNFNTKNVNNMSRMFWYCISLKELDISNFNTDKAKDWDICYGCSSLNLKFLEKAKKNN